MVMADYKEVSFKDITVELSDGLHAAPKFYPNGDYIFVNAKNIVNGRILDVDPDKKTSYSEYLKYKIDLDENTVLYSIDGTIGNVAKYRGEKVVLGKGACYLKLKPEVDTNYIFFYLQSPQFKAYIRKMSTGSTIRHISLKTMRNHKFNLPDLLIQKKIANILSRIQNKIDTNQQINENLQEQAQAIYRHMIIENANASWTPGVLSDIAIITMGQSPKGESYNEEGIGTVFFQGRAEFGFRFPARRLYTTDPKRMARANDALMSVRAPVGDINVAYEDCCIGRGLGAIRSNDGHQSFILYTMLALHKQFSMFNGEGTVFGSINRDALNSMPVDIPPKEVMDQFEDIVAPMDTAILNNYDEICRLQAMRDTLLPQLMSGELDVSELNI